MDITIRSTTDQDFLYHWALAVDFIMILICTDIILDMPDSDTMDTDSLATTATDTVDMDSAMVDMAMVDMAMADMAMAGTVMDTLHVCT